METRNLGSSGLLVSAIGLGCNNFGGRIDLEASRSVVHKALDCGITLLDTADVYGERGGSETCLGEILGKRRHDIVLASKFGMPMDDAGTLKGGSRRYIMQAVEASLKRLRTDWIDLYQLHQRIPGRRWKKRSARSMIWYGQGKIRYAGCSNLAGWQVMQAGLTTQHAGLNGFISCQDEYSLLVRNAERELMPAANALGMGLLPYFPLASGLLTGKYKRNAPLPEGARLTKTQRLADRYLTDAHWPVVEKLADFCEQRGRTMLELAFSWLLARKPVSSVIAGATKPEQIEQNVKAGDWAMTGGGAGGDRRHLWRRTLTP